MKKEFREGCVNRTAIGGSPKDPKGRRGWVRDINSSESGVCEEGVDMGGCEVDRLSIG